MRGHQTVATLCHGNRPMHVENCTQKLWSSANSRTGQMHGASSELQRLPGKTLF